MSAITHFGHRDNTGSSNVSMPAANNKAVSRVENDTGAAVLVDRLHANWHGSAYPTAKIKAVIYSDNAGSPDTLLATSDERIGIAAASAWDWEEFVFSAPVSVASGAFVWIGFISDTTITSSRGVAAGNHLFNADAYSDGPSATFGSSSSSTLTLPAFAAGGDGALRFGRSAVDVIGGNYQPDREHGDKFVLDVPGAAEISSISTYVKTTSAAVKSKAVIFEDNGGVPGAKIAQTNEVTGATADTWLTLPFASPPVLGSGTYWLAFICDTNLVTPVSPSGGFLMVDGTDTEATAFTSPSSLRDNAQPNGIDIYATYTEVASPTTSARVTQVAVEALRTNNAASARLSQLAVEVLRINAAESSVTPIAGEITGSLTGTAALSLGTPLSGAATASVTGAADLATGTHLAATGRIEVAPRGRLAGAAAIPGAGNFFLLF